VHDKWLSMVQDHDVVSHLRDAGREIAFTSAWLARMESRRQEFGEVVQGDFHVGYFYSHPSPFVRELPSDLRFLVVEWLMACWE
jgi:hypothetical protein